MQMQKLELLAAFCETTDGMEPRADAEPTNRLASRGHFPWFSGDKRKHAQLAGAEAVRPDLRLRERRRLDIRGRTAHWRTDLLPRS